MEELYGSSKACKPGDDFCEWEEGVGEGRWQPTFKHRLRGGAAHQALFKIVSYEEMGDRSTRRGGMEVCNC